MSTPATLPADFQGWDKAPATLPADFNKWDEQPKPQESATSRFGSSALRGAGVMTPEEGKNFFTHPLDTAKGIIKSQGDTGNLAIDELKQGKYGQGLSDLAYSAIPFLGPTLSHAGHQLTEGDIAGGAGTTIGAALPIAAGSPEVRSGIAKVTSPEVAAAPIRLAARTAEVAANKTIRPLTKIMTPADEAAKAPIKIPGRDLGLRPRSAPSVEPEATFPGAHLPDIPAPEQLNPSLVSKSRTLPGEHSPEVIRPKIAKPTPAEAIPNRSGLALPAGPPEPSAGLGKIPVRGPNVSPKNVGGLLNDSLGGEGLKPNVPLKNQLRGINAQPADALPKDFTPVKSSALRGYKYDTAAKELSVITKDGSGHVYGDVSPEQAQSFKDNPSSGKAWEDLRNSASAKVAKIVNGKRVAVKPPNDLASATPDSEAPEPRIPGPKENMSKLGKQSLELLAKRRGIAKPNQ